MVFGLVAVALVGVYHLPYADGSFPRQLQGYYLRTYAAVAGRLIALFDPRVVIDGILIAGRFQMRIVRSCDAFEAIALVVAAVVAFPATWRQRLLGGGAAVAALFAVNVLRLGSLYLVGVLRPDLFELFHAEVWPPVIIAVAAALFLAWAARVQRSPSSDAVQARAAP